MKRSRKDLRTLNPNLKMFAYDKFKAMVDKKIHLNPSFPYSLIVLPPLKLC